MSARSLIVAAALVAAVFLFATSFIRIAPNEIGVRTNNVRLWSGQGIVQQDFGPGWHLNLPMATSWSVFPSGIRRVEMTKDPRHRSSLGGEALMVQSSDGDRVMLDLHMFYRIEPGSAHRVLQDSGPGDAHVNVLRTLANDRLRAVFGSLSTEQFYDPLAREEKAAEALAALNEALQARDLHVVQLAIQDVEFEPKYEQKIKEKKLADQTVELNKAESRSAAERAKVAQIRALTTREVQLIEAQADAEVARIKAESVKYQAERRGEADLYREQQRAEGTLAVAQSQARVTQGKTAALAGSGGSNLAAMEAVKNLKVDTIAFPTTSGDWFDVRDMATRLGARP